MPYFESPCSLPQNRVLLPCQRAEICRPFAWLWVIKPLIYRVLSALRCIGVRFGIDFFPGFSRAAGKFASTASATIAPAPPGGSKEDADVLGQQYILVEGYFAAGAWKIAGRKVTLDQNVLLAKNVSIFF